MFTLVVFRRNLFLYLLLFVKGQIEYVEMGNHWILVRFANAQDKMLVVDKRPYFVNGMNFVVKPWILFLDPYSSSVDRVDQWTRISRLPWMFWE